MVAMLGMMMDMRTKVETRNREAEMASMSWANKEAMVMDQGR